MNLVSFYSGIGGFELAGEWVGWDIISSCEINPFGQKVLKYYWPNAYHHSDVKTIDYEKIKQKINKRKPTIFVSGFPCQPFSIAGKRKGIEDDRYGWPDCIKAVRELSPDYCVFENVFGIVNWDGGMVFNQVQSDLEAEGYEVQPYVLPACAVNAPHRRDRVWFVAYNEHYGNRRRQQQQESEQEKSGVAENARSNGCPNGEHDKQRNFGNIGESCTGGEERDFIGEALQDASNSDCNGFNGGNSEHEINTSEGGEYAQRNVEQMGGDAIHSQQQGLERANWLFESERLKQGCKEYDATNAISIGQPGKEYREKERRRITETGVPNDWQDFPTQPPVCGIYDGISEWILRNIKSEIYATISKRYTDKDLQEMWKAIQSQEIQEQIRGLYKIHEKGVLFQTMQLCSPSNRIEKGFSVWSEKASKNIMRKLSKYGTITNSPQGRELEKQFTEQFADTLPYLSHEVALVAMETEKAAAKFKSWHRNESIKAYGNAIVPAVAFQIFKAINEHTKHTDN
jgi:DNA (cytosine-5)-methyltransferase 1